MLRVWSAAALALGLVPAALVAAAAARRPPAPICDNVDVMRPCQEQPGWGQPSQPARGALVSSARYIAIIDPDAHQRGLKRLAAAFAVPPAVRLAHPDGCPARAFCGCGAAVRVFGWPVRELWLAARWLEFPRAAPGVGMVAVKRHHVFVLEQHISGSTWLAYDANSGRHATQLHARSIDGFVIVNPRAG